MLCIFPLCIWFLSGCSKEDAPTMKQRLGREELDIAYGTDPMHKMDIYTPEGYGMETPVVFLIHGGGFIAGSRADFTQVAKRFRDRGYIAVNVEHRLINMLGLLNQPPLHQLFNVQVQDQVQDLGMAVTYFKENAQKWGISTQRLYMAGHSAGGTLAMLYVQGENNQGVIASGNFAGLASLTLPDQLYEQAPDHALWPALKELLYRMSGQEVVPEHRSALQAISANWLAEQHQPGKPNITVMSESNDADLHFEPFISTIEDAEEFHHQLLSYGTPSAYKLMDTDHGFGRHPEDWSKAVEAVADFFDAQSH